MHISSPLRDILVSYLSFFFLLGLAILAITGMLSLLAPLVG